MNSPKSHRLSLHHAFAAQYSHHAELEESRDRNKLRLKGKFESIFKKYEKDFSEIADEIDLESGQVVVDNGHLDIMEHDRDVGLPDSRYEEPASDDEPDLLHQYDLEAKVNSRFDEDMSLTQTSQNNSQYPSPSKFQSTVRNPYFSVHPPQNNSLQSMSELSKKLNYDPSVIQQICQAVTASVMQAMTKSPYPTAPPVESAWQAPPLPNSHGNRHHTSHASRRMLVSSPRRQSSQRLRSPGASIPARTKTCRPVPRPQSIWALPDNLSSSSESRSPSPGAGSYPTSSYAASHEGWKSKRMQNPLATATGINPCVTPSSRCPLLSDANRAPDDRKQTEHSEQSETGSAIDGDTGDEDEDDIGHRISAKSRELPQDEVSTTMHSNNGETSRNPAPRHQKEDSSEILTAGRCVDSWSDEDEELLMKLRETDGLSWHIIRKYFPTRTHDGIVSHWKAIRRRGPGHRRLHLQREQQEDDAGASSGLTTFKLIIPRNDAEYEPRPVKRDFPRRSWTIDHQILLIKLKELDGRSWDTIMKYFPSRTRESVKSRWKSIIYQRPTFFAQLMERARKLRQEERKDLKKNRIHVQSIESISKIYQEQKMEAVQDDAHAESEGKPLHALHEKEEMDPNYHPFNIELTKMPPSIRPDSGPGRIKPYTREDDELLVQLRKSHKIRWKECVEYFPPRTLDSLFARWKRLTQWYNGEKDAPQPYNGVIDGSSLDFLEPSDLDSSLADNSHSLDFDESIIREPLETASNPPLASSRRLESIKGSSENAGDDLIDPALRTEGTTVNSPLSAEDLPNTMTLEHNTVDTVSADTTETNKTNVKAGERSTLLEKVERLPKPAITDNTSFTHGAPAEADDSGTFQNQRALASPNSVDLSVKTVAGSFCGNVPEVIEQSKGPNAELILSNHASQSGRTFVSSTKKRKSANDLERPLKHPSMAKSTYSLHYIDQGISKRLAPPRSRSDRSTSAVYTKKSRSVHPNSNIFASEQEPRAKVAGPLAHPSRQVSFEMKANRKSSPSQEMRGRLPRHFLPKMRHVPSDPRDSSSTNKTSSREAVAHTETMDDMDELA